MLTHQTRSHYILYSTKFWRGKNLADQSFQNFGKENVGEFTVANISCFSDLEFGWANYILANDVCFTKFTKVFPRQNFVLYGNNTLKV